MPAQKKSSKAQVKVKDLKAKKNPKGGVAGLKTNANYKISGSPNAIYKRGNN